MKQNLAGKYELYSHGIYDSQGEFKATSDYLKGELCYGSDKTLSLIILFKEEIKSPRDILAYSGQYEVVSEKEILHKISFSSHFSKIQTVEKRGYKFDGNNLKLTAKLDDNQLFEALWRKK